MKHLPSSQLEVMLIIWEADRPITRSEIQQNNLDKDWKTTTLNTALERLTNNGFLQCDKQGREYVYSPKISVEEYSEYESKNLFNQLFKKSITDFVATMYKGGNLSCKEIDELQDFLNNIKKKRP